MEEKCSHCINGVAKIIFRCPVYAEAYGEIEICGFQNQKPSSNCLKKVQEKQCSEFQGLKKEVKVIFSLQLFIYLFISYLLVLFVRIIKLCLPSYVAYPSRKGNLCQMNQVDSHYGHAFMKRTSTATAHQKYLKVSLVVSYHSQTPQLLSRMRIYSLRNMCKGYLVFNI